MKPVQQWSAARKVLIPLVLVLAVLLFFILITKSRNEFRTRIATQKGIQVETSYHINGAAHAVQIRGENEDNPIVLFLHGGPGNPLAFYSYLYQLPLEKKFTFVHWDQKGAGRTYYQNRKQGPIGVEATLDDLDTLIDLLRVQFKQDKVILLGHSWGTYIGSVYADRQPEKVMGVVSVGQLVTSLKETDLYASKEAMRVAKELGKTDASEEIRKLSDRLGTAKDFTEFTTQDMVRLRETTYPYLPHGKELSVTGLLWNAITSPNITADDLRWGIMSIQDPAKMLKIQEPLLNDSAKSGSVQEITKVQVPIYFIVGSEDWVTPRLLIEAYAQEIEAPAKGIIVLDGAGHNPMLEDPALFSKTLLSALTSIMQAAEKKTP